MVKLLHWLKAHLPTQRRLIQLYTALLYNAHIKGFIKGDIFTGNTKMLCVPGLNCYSCPGATGACPLGALQNAVASSGNRLPFYIVGILLLYGLILGRTICGFLCPFGLIQELLHKLPTPKVPKGIWSRRLSWLKYLILAVFVFLIPMYYALSKLPLPAFCKYICPAGTLEGAVALLSHPVNADKYSMLGSLFTGKFLILLAVVGICVFVYRAFCRFLCPLGAIYGMFSRLALIGVRVELPKCVDCGKCVACCKMDIRCVGDHECIHCGECIDVCPTKAISIKAGKITLHGPQTGTSPYNRKRRMRLLAWMAAVLLLLGCLVCFNQPDNEVPLDQSAMQTENIGYTPGKYAPDFEVPLYGTANTFRLSDHRGKKVVVNFWATWCTPCCKELPYFDAIADHYADDVVVIAIHSDLVTDDVEVYLSSYDYNMPFGHDVTGEVIAGFGGSTMLPHTVIIDEQGSVIYNATGSLSYEALEMLLSFTSSE